MAVTHLSAAAAVCANAARFQGHPSHSRGSPLRATARGLGQRYPGRKTDTTRRMDFAPKGNRNSISEPPNSFNPHSAKPVILLCQSGSDLPAAECLGLRISPSYLSVVASLRNRTRLTQCFWRSSGCVRFRCIALKHTPHTHTGNSPNLLSLNKLWWTRTVQSGRGRNPGCRGQSRPAGRTRYGGRARSPDCSMAAAWNERLTRPSEPNIAFVPWSRRTAW